MKRLLKDAFKGDVDLDDVRVIYDIVGWMNEKINKIENHSKPHNFKFEKIAGEVNLFYRHWSSSDCLLYTSPSPRDATLSRMPSSA